MRTKLIYQCYSNLETESQNNLLITFTQSLVTHSKLSLIFTKMTHAKVHMPT